MVRARKGKGKKILMLPLGLRRGNERSTGTLRRREEKEANSTKMGQRSQYNQR